MTVEEETELRQLLNDLIDICFVGGPINDAEAAVERIVERVRRMVVERAPKETTT